LSNEDSQSASLSLTLKESESLFFLPLLQQGFMVKSQVGCSVEKMLHEQYGLSPEYVEDRIKTVFLDGRPVDDLGRAVIKDGSTLALSAAMPGLVGATMRRGGVLASFRSTIAYSSEEGLETSGEGMIVVKLFNLLIDELGATFLERGIWVKREVLEEFLRARGRVLHKVCETIRVDGKEVTEARWSELNWPDETHLVLLRVWQGG
jgi:hypothetical protein